jgi:hypothetical protein
MSVVREKVGVVFVGCVLGMQEDLFYDEITESEPTKSEPTYCHYGLTRWLYGCMEYAEVCLCGSVGPPWALKNTRYVHKFEIRRGLYDVEVRDYEIKTDCWFYLHRDESIHSDWYCVTACLCCPFATLVHVVCLPNECCILHGRSSETIMHTTYNFTYTPPIKSPETIERERLLAKYQSDHDILFKHRHCTPTVCICPTFDLNAPKCTGGRSPY